MKSLSITALFVLAFGVAAHATQGTTNDLPNVILTCHESSNGVIVLDGAKSLFLSRDQFGQATLTVVQRDQFSGDVALIKNLPLSHKACQGFSPCESYEANQGSTQFFVNHIPNSKVLDGHLASSVAGDVDFICRK